MSLYIYCLERHIRDEDQVQSEDITNRLKVYPDLDLVSTRRLKQGGEPLIDALSAFTVC